MYNFDSCYIENYCLQSVTKLSLLTVMKHIYAWYYSVLSGGANKFHTHEWGHTKEGFLLRGGQKENLQYIKCFKSQYVLDQFQCC